MNEYKYFQPKSVEEAVTILNKEKKVVVYGGGTDMLSLIKKNITAPEAVVNIKSIGDLNGIKYTDGKGLELGALVKIADIGSNEKIKTAYRVIHEAALEIASPQLRNMGTLGGNLCQRPRCWYFRDDFDCIRKGGGECFAVEGRNKYHCIIGGGPCYIVYPSDTAVALLALDADITIQGQDGEKTIPIKDFHILPEDNPLKENILETGEFVTKVFVPEFNNNTKSGYVKFKERASWDFAVISVAAVLETTGGRIKKAKVAFGGAAPKPWMDEKFNRTLENVSTDEDSLEKVCSDLFKDAEPMSENKYKIPLARNLTKRLLVDLTNQ